MILEIERYRWTRIGCLAFHVHHDWLFNGSRHWTIYNDWFNFTFQVNYDWLFNSLSELWLVVLYFSDWLFDISGELWLVVLYFRWIMIGCFYVGTVPVFLAFFAVSLLTHYENWDPVLLGVKKILHCICRRRILPRYVSSIFYFMPPLINEQEYTVIVFVCLAVCVLPTLTI